MIWQLACSQGIAGELPTPDGPHPVGTTAFVWHYQPDVAVGFDAPWLHGPRQLVVQVWYPAAAPGDATAAYVLHADRIAVTESTAPNQLAATQRLLQFATTRTHSYIDAVVAATPRRLPVVVFSPGGNLPRHAYTALYESLASHGYVVAAISHPGMGLDWFPAYGVMPAAAEWKAGDTADEEALDAHYEPLAKLLAADATFVVEQLRELAQDRSTGILSGRLMTRPVAVVGHSRGGKTVARYCSGASPCWAAVILDNFPPAADRARGFRCPTLILRTATVVPPRWNAYRLAELARLQQANAATLQDRPLEDIDHMSFTDLPVLAADDPADKDKTRALQRVLNEIRSFLDRASIEQASDE